MATLYGRYYVCFKDKNTKTGSESDMDASQLESRLVTPSPVLRLRGPTSRRPWTLWPGQRTWWQGLGSEARLPWWESQLHYWSVMQLRQMCSLVCLNFFNLENEIRDTVYLIRLHCHKLVSTNKVPIIMATTVWCSWCAWHCTVLFMCINLFHHCNNTRDKLSFPF